MSVQLARHEVSVDCEVRVARGRAGDLDDGIDELFAKVDPVADCEVRDVREVTPDAFDLYVDTAVVLTVEAPADRDAAELRADVRDGFGVVSIDRFEPHA